MSQSAQTLLSPRIYNRLSGTLLSMALLSLPILAEAGHRDNVRGMRYCEIIVSKTRLSLSVYNTFGLNDCPATIWDKINEADIKKETGASFVHLNGPRYWVLDDMKNATVFNPEEKTFAGLTMREAGVLHVSLMDIFRGSAPYRPHTVDRHTTWVFKAGKPVYEIIDGQGHAYVMQSYYAGKEFSQTVKGLSNLGSALKLPRGWHFRTGILKHEAKVVAVNNKATVIQDNFLNTYQLAASDVLND